MCVERYRRAERMGVHGEFAQPDGTGVLLDYVLLD